MQRYKFTYSYQDGTVSSCIVEENTLIAATTIFKQIYGNNVTVLNIGRLFTNDQARNIG